MSRRKRVLVIGGSGYFGRSIVMSIQEHADVVTTHCNNPIITNSIKFDFFGDDVERVFRGYIFDCVVIAVKIEFSVEQVILFMCMEKFLRHFHQAHIIYISSDGVFDGARGIYTEEDEPCPVTLYGENLKFCEDLVREKCRSWSIVRPSYIYGYSVGKLDSRLSMMREKIIKGVETPFMDMFKSPVDVNYAAHAIGNMSLQRHQGIVHLAGKRMSVYQFYRRSMKALGESVKNLVPVHMPELRLRKSNMLQDTSLDNKLMLMLFGTHPTIEESLRKEW